MLFLCPYPSVFVTIYSASCPGSVGDWSIVLLDSMPDCCTHIVEYIYPLGFNFKQNVIAQPIQLAVRWGRATF
jgi:hypothetical protein